MKYLSPARSSVFALLLVAAAPAQTQLELGKMWTFENPPLAYLQDEYGFEANQQWLDSLRLASLRFGNWCSASFVSPKGLIMTNNHCVRDNIAQVSPPGSDLVKNGFVAQALEDEIKLTGLTVQQLVSMRDVTGEMLAGIEESDSNEAAEEKRTDNEKRIMAAAAEAHPQLTPQVVKLHQGAAFQLYLYKVYDDIRLVVSPHLQTAHFGGDPDNFTYPRFSIDFSFCRAYENDQPADTTEHYFRWSKTGPKNNELVFVTGNPGSTGRLLTYAQMEYMRDAYYPLILEMISNRLTVLREFVARVPRLEEQLRTVILGDENSVKALGGYLGGLLDPKLMADKLAFEQGFQQKIMADDAQAAKFGGAWKKLAEISEQKTALEAKAHFQVPGYSGHLGKALAIVIAVDPATSDEEREAAKAMVLGQPLRVDALQHALIIDHLQRAERWLGRDDPFVQAVMGNLTAEAAAERLRGSQVASSEFVAELLEGGQDAVDACDDIAVVAARVLAPLTKHNQELSEKLAAAEAVQERLIGQALFACYGDNISPDATMTLRFSDGRVEGYDYNGTVAPWRTTFYGLYGRNVEFGGEYPFNLPEIWIDRKDDVDLTKSVNFVSTNDIIGGNSGSPVVNSDLEVVGLIFDGNIEQLPNRFIYRSDVERSVSVHIEGINESLLKIYNATRILEELTQTDVSK